MTEPWRCQGVKVDSLRRRVTVAGQAMSLTPQEYYLVALPVRSAGRVITHQQPLRSVWGPEHAGDVQYLRVYVGHLRQELGAADASFVKTEAGVGYRLAAPDEPV